MFKLQILLAPIAVNSKMLRTSHLTLKKHQLLLKGHNLPLVIQKSKLLVAKQAVLAVQSAHLLIWKIVKKMMKPKRQNWLKWKFSLRSDFIHIVISSSMFVFCHLIVFFKTYLIWLVCNLPYGYFKRHMQLVDWNFMFALIKRMIYLIYFFGLFI